MTACLARRDRGLAQVQAVQRPALDVDRRFGRVQVLRLLARCPSPGRRTRRSRRCRGRSESSAGSGTDRRTVRSSRWTTRPLRSSSGSGKPSLSRRALQRLAARRRVAERRSCSIVSAVRPRSCELPPRRRAGRRRQLLAEPRRRDFVHLQQRLALALRRRASCFESSGSGTVRPTRAASCRTASGNVDLVVQLDELDDVAADAAAEAVEEPLVAVDLERRRLLAVERTQPLPRRRRSAAAARAPGSTCDDVGLRLQVVDEGLAGNRASSHSVLQLHDRRPPPPPWFSGAGAKLRDERMRAENSAIARRSCPVP